MTQRAWVLLLICIGCLGLFVAGCGGGDDSASSPSSTEAESTAATPEEGSEGDVVATAEAELENFKLGNAEFPQPEEPVDPGKHKVAIVSCGQEGAGCAIMTEGLQDAIKAAGWESSPVLNGKFDPALQGRLIMQAVQEGYEAIFLDAIDTGSVKASVDAALDKDILVLCNTCESTATPGVIDVGANGHPDGEGMAWWSIVNTAGKGQIVAIDDKAFTVVGNRVESYQETIEANCPECDLEVIQMATAELAKPGPPVFAAALSSHPAGTLELGIPPYDAAVIPMADYIEQAGREDVKTFGYEALPPTLEVMEQNPEGPIAGSIVLPYYFSSWLMVDIAAREFAGQETYEANDLPVAIIDSSEAPELKDPTVQIGYDFPAHFEQIWTAK